MLLWSADAVQPKGEVRLDELRLEFTARFRQICREMHEDDFAQLVDEMAKFRLKYEELEARLAVQSSPVRRPDG